MSTRQRPAARSDEQMTRRQERLSALDTVLHMQRSQGQGLASFAEDPDEWVRTKALDAIVERRDILAAPLLMARLDDTDEMVRWTAAEGLGVLRYEPAVRRLLDVLQGDSHWLVRASAADALAQIGTRSRQVVDGLTTALLMDRKPLVRGHAASALAELGDEDSVGAIRRRLRRERNQLARVFLLWSLWRLGDNGALNSLLRMFAGSSDEDVQYAIYSVLPNPTDPQGDEVSAAVASVLDRNPGFWTDPPPMIRRVMDKFGIQL